jgi:DNA-binding PadR family transcriptional regulator
MPKAERSPDTFVPLADLPFQILLALGEGASHGYAMGKEIEERTSGRLNPTTGSLYQALRRLREDGLIEPAEPPATEDNGDARRRYFQLTPFGKRVMALEVERLEGLISVARERSLAPKRS